MNNIAINLNCNCTPSELVEILSALSKDTNINIAPRKNVGDGRKLRATKKEMALRVIIDKEYNDHGLVPVNWQNIDERITALKAKGYELSKESEHFSKIDVDGIKVPT